jgi:hypothetical protein
VHNIKLEHLEIIWNDVEWIGEAQDNYNWRAVLNAVMTFVFL